ncbi:hypothetical protein [Sphingomonas faeni]|uniref:hypothetical protein n=1 Tax=Sphingomonas faeni TaxID=185950 RepID=UPI003358635B
MYTHDGSDDTNEREILVLDRVRAGFALASIVITTAIALSLLQIDGFCRTSGQRDRWPVVRADGTPRGVDGYMMDKQDGPIVVAHFSRAVSGSMALVPAP